MTDSAMADGVEISSDLENWAGNAGYSLTPTDQNGRAVFSTSDSEIRYFIEKVNERWFRVTCSNRMGPAQFELAAPSMSTIETYFYGLFGADVRYRAPLKQARTDPRRRDDGFVIRKFPETDPDYFAFFQNADHEHLALYNAGELAAVDGFGKIMAEVRLTKLAVYLSVSTAEIKDAFERADGGRLLVVDDDDGEGTGAGAGAGTLVPS
jgi:Immunity protein 61